MEVILFVIEEINSKKYVDFNVMLGCDIRDICFCLYKVVLDLVLNRLKELFLVVVVGKFFYDE